MEELIKLAIESFDPKVFSATVGVVFSLGFLLMFKKIISKLKTFDMSKVGIIRPALLGTILLSTFICLNVHLDRCNPDLFPLAYIPVLILGYITSTMSFIFCLVVLHDYESGRGRNRGWW